MTHLLALDQGTTSSRALLFDREGNPVAIAQREFAQHYPQPGWVEHNPNDIWDTQFQTAIEAIKTAGITAGDVAAIGITNQRETCLLWDRQTGTACGPAIVWQDRRTSAMCDSLLEQGYEDFVQTRSGLLLDPYFSASKLRWMLDQDPDLRRRAEAGELAFGTIDSWLVWKLSEGRAHITDATNASRTGLCNLQTSSWDTELLELWGVPQAVLPVIVDSSGICTTTTLLGPEIPIAGIAGDQQAALFGQACYEPGMAKCTYGTGCFLLMQTGTTAVRSNHRLLTTIAARVGGITEYALEGSVFMGGATIQWLRDGLKILSSAGDVEALAADVKDSDGVVLVPAFTGLGAPYWDATASALLIGMTRGTTPSHIARAALDAIAWQVFDVAEAMCRDADLQLSELRVDGGASENALLMQLQANVLNASLVRPVVAESTAYGAALLAGLGIGLFENRQALAQQWRARDRFQPEAVAEDIAANHERWRRAVARSRDWYRPT